ncbi:hypothetical protein E4K68_08350 [Desulfosporosinus sp. Sb-LF]|nr:hypothetical protein E4K68_08350 [Desulfosporosinus sp. Sb-LF]
MHNITKYCKRTTIRDNSIPPHTFRLSFAIEFLRNGGSTASLRTQLGHMSIATVEKYLYFANTHIISDTKRFNPLDKSFYLSIAIPLYYVVDLVNSSFKS